MSGKLRTAIEDMTRENLQAHGLTAWWAAMKARREEALGWQTIWLTKKGANAFSIPFGLVYAVVAYTLTGSASAKALGLSYAAEVKASTLSDQIAGLISTVESMPLLQEISKTYGAIFSVPFEAFFNQYAGHEDMDVEEFIHSVHGVNATINLQAGILGALYEIAGLGQTQAFNDIAASMQETIPARLISTRLTGPMLDAGIGGNVTRFFNKKYRPTRFKASDLRDLYALGEISQEQVRAGASGEGWRDEDIDQWIRLAFRKMAQGDIFTALHKGFIQTAEATQRLRALGYDPADIPLLFQLNPDPDALQDKQASASDARAAFRDGVVSENQLMALLEASGYSSAAIGLILAIEKAKIQSSAKNLSVGEIRSAWADNVLTDQEAFHWLDQAGIDPERAAILLQTWKRQVAPAFRKLNSGTILEAYVAGVVSRGQAGSKLGSIGFSADDADLELRLAELRNPDVFGGASVAQSKRVGPSQLAQLVALGLLTPAQMSVRLQSTGYTDEDANLLAEAARLRAQPAERSLPQSVVEQSYLAGVITRVQAADLLGKLGYTADQADLILAAFEAKNAAAFGADPAVRARGLGQAQLEQLYLAGILDEVVYRSRLADLGYNAGDTDLIVARDNQLLTPLPQALTQSSIEQAYIAGVYDRNTAYNRLMAADFTPESANTLLDTVEARNPAAFSPGLVQSTRVPSITTLVAALQNGVISQDEYTARAQELGYSPDDAGLYVALAVTAEKKSVQALSLGQIQAAYGKGFMSRGAALARVITLGYSQDDAVLLLRITKESLQLTDTWDSLLSGALGPFDAIAALASANYSDEDIYAAFAALDPGTRAAMGIDLEQLKLTLAATPGGE
jgi:hypothetical protein